MEDTARQSYCPIGLLGKVVLIFLLSAVNIPPGRGQTTVSEGTVNIGLSNANGIVLLTDSALSHKDARGEWHHDKTIQKLFRLDSNTVCSIAGFASETGWVPSQLDIEVPGIIAEVRDQLSQKPVPDLDAKVHL